jgi:hypothetical protein
MASHVIAKFVGEYSVRFETEFSVTGRMGKPGMWEQVAEACGGGTVLHLNHQGNLTGRALLFSTNSFVEHLRDLAGVYHDLRRSSARIYWYSAVPGCTCGAAAFELEHGSFLLLVSDADKRSLPRSVVDDDGSQECIPSCHGRTTT